MRLQRKLLIGCAGIVVSLVPLAGVPAITSAATVADSATISNVATCAFVSADDPGSGCQYVQNSFACTQARVTVACNVTATLTEPGGDKVGLAYKLTGTLVGSDIFVFATAVTGTATDDGAAHTLVGQYSGTGCQIIDCGFTTPVVLTLVW